MGAGTCRATECLLCQLCQLLVSIYHDNHPRLVRYCRAGISASPSLMPDTANSEKSRSEGSKILGLIYFVFFSLIVDCQWLKPSSLPPARPRLKLQSLPKSFPKSENTKAMQFPFLFSLFCSVDLETCRSLFLALDLILSRPWCSYFYGPVWCQSCWTFRDEVLSTGDMPYENKGQRAGVLISDCLHRVWTPVPLKTPLHCLKPCLSRRIRVHQGILNTIHGANC